MPVFMFWNINKKPLHDEIGIACHEHNVDILILAESELDAPTLLRSLNSHERRGFFEDSRPLTPSLFQFFIRVQPNAFVKIHDDRRFAIRRLHPPVGKEILIVATHLPSKKHADEADQAHALQNLMKAIEEHEKNLGHASSMVIGDLNMNPFEMPMTGANMLHGVMDSSIARKEKRKVEGREYRYFYNPMWSRMGDGSIGPPGTYYYDKGHTNTYFWNTFDQVLLRPNLLPAFVHENLKVLTRIGGSELVSDGRIAAQYSDHLPIIVRLDLERTI